MARIVLDFMRSDPVRSIREFFALRLLVGFIGVGVINLIGGLILFQVLLFFMSYRAAYSITFVLSVLFSLVANGRVFNSELTLPKVSLFVINYLLTYFIGLSLLIWFVGLGIAERVAPLLVIPIVTPINFAFTRICLVGFGRR